MLNLFTIRIYRGAEKNLLKALCKYKVLGRSQHFILTTTQTEIISYFQLTSMYCICAVISMLHALILVNSYEFV